MIKKLLKSVREYKKESILTPIFMIGEVLSDVIVTFLMSYLIDKGIDNGNMKYILIFGASLLGAAFISLIFGVLSGKYASIASNGFAKNLRQDLYYKISNYSFKNIDKFSTSSIITRLTTDVTNVQNSYQMLIRIAVRAPLMFIFSLIMILKISPKLSLIFLVIAPILFAILIIIIKIAHPYFESVFKTYDEINNVVKENVSGIRVVKSYVQENSEKNKFHRVSEKIYELFSKAQKLTCFSSPVCNLSMYLSVLLISFFGAKMIVGGTLTTGQLTSLFTYSMSILGSLMMISMIYVMMIISIPSMKRVVELLDEENDITNCSKPIKEMKDGSIEFKNVSFSYVNDMDKLALKKININIASGETIGIIGSTGTGKSSLVNLIPRLYDVTEGEVLVSGVNVKDYDIKFLRDNVSMVLQKNVLFSGTIRENLLWGNKDASDAEIRVALDVSGSKEFVDKLPEKLNYHLEAGATNLSGGQKQRLCIARALLKNPKIIIFDDSTSACDTKTDAKIRKGLKSYMPKVTKLIIAQRIASVEDADKVIVIDKGKIVDFDTPENLLKTSKIYKEISDSQKKGGNKNE